MAIHCANGRASVVRLAFNLNDLPAYLQRGVDANSTTPEIERAGQELAAENFPERLSAEFVRKVCYWGGYAGISGKVLRYNDGTRIAETLRRAVDLTSKGDVKSAMEAMLGLNGLGVSFASKHLKFLNPDRHVVLDRIISERLGYPRTPDGYIEFVSDCGSILDAVQAAGIVRKDENPFRIADVEMAIYQILGAQ